ncbi:MAG: transposase, partial [Clostridia bacterium]
MKNNTTSNPKMVTISRTEYESLKERNAELSHMNDLLIEQIRLSRQKRFGASSEQTTDDGMEQLSLLFNEAEVYAAQPEAPVETPTHARKNQAMCEIFYPKICLLMWWSTVCL